METPVVLALAGIFGLLALIYLVMQSGSSPAVSTKSKEQKRREIIVGYEEEIETALESLREDPVKMRAEKVRLLGRFSKELEMNVFFDADEKRSMITELAAY